MGAPPRPLDAPLPGSADAASTPRRAVVLFAHGARDPRWAEPFLAVAERVRARAPGAHVELAFLELMAPDLATLVRTLARAGIERVDIAPLFLGSGSHLRHDLPRLVEALRAAHAGIDIRLHPAIGEHAAVIDAMAAAAVALTGLGE